MTFAVRNFLHCDSTRINVRAPPMCKFILPVWHIIYTYHPFMSLLFRFFRNLSWTICAVVNSVYGYICNYLTFSVFFLWFVSFTITAICTNFINIFLHMDNLHNFSELRHFRLFYLFISPYFLCPYRYPPFFTKTSRQHGFHPFYYIEPQPMFGKIPVQKRKIFVNHVFLPPFYWQERPVSYII